MNKILPVIVLINAVRAILSAISNDAPLDGYTAENSRTERQWEGKFRSLPSSDNQKEYMRRLTARPHHVGSPYDKDNAEWILAKFKEWGFDAHIEAFDVLFPTPKEVKLEMIEPRKFAASLAEPPIAVDPTTSQTSEQLPAYNAYSRDGDVTAPLVYVNYGMPDDYEELERYGASVRGAIVIARYGHGWRGVKPKVAAEHGAVGCIIYSDPLDDGYTDGEVYPEGPWRPPSGIQRGSVMDTDYPGDPLTPGFASVPGAKRLSLQEAPTITKIPVLPISYADAQPLLAELRGRVAPRGWRGGLPITYHIGPGKAKVHLKMISNWDQKTIYDVIAKIAGSERPDEWILRGNHHDAWVNGAEDPISGLITLLEEARSFGELVKQGWKPKRTIIYCAWDGEEPGLLGSTEWVEAHADELRQHAVAYFNSDTNARGYMRAEGSHTLEKFINSVARDVMDPEKDITVWERRKLYDIAHASSSEQREEIRKRPDLRIGALGDGSDYTAFIHHLGIASMDIRFSGETSGGVYHSIYDDFYWYTHFGDPKFQYGRAESQLVGTVVMRLADADLLPFDFTDFADTVKMYLNNIQKQLKNEQDELRERNREIDEGAYTASSDPEKPLRPPQRAEVPPHFNFAPLENAIDTLAASADRYAKAAAKIQTATLALYRPTLERVNRLLMQSGPALTDPTGLPGRPWFKNQIYAPGAYTGYEAKPLPGVLEAMDRKYWQQAESQIPREAAALERETRIIAEAAGELEAVVAESGFEYLAIGNTNGEPANRSSGFALMGGGSDQDAAFQWICERGTGPFVVLRASGTETYNPYISSVCPNIDSVETLVIQSREGARQPFVARKILDSGVLFIAGGNQGNYLNFWQGTPVQEAINAAVSGGVPAGGTSAGLAVLGEYVFSALNDTIQSTEALRNPYDRRVTISRDFLHIPHLEGKITDSHFVARDRMGRLVVFLARIAQNGWTPAPYGIGIDEKTAVLVQPTGRATVDGKGAAYFLHAPGPPKECRPDTPLTYKGVSVYRLGAEAGQFNLSSWIGTGGTAYTLSVNDGVLKSSLPNGEIY
ncbi:MAG: M28 family peptidase [Acidobacteriaceae bacterium]|nr:M28 family peptidase [Acidobacteriaceae bacterium]MBV9781489.1 M28 family peptidase [Acidobacteriaceae bacterium]